MPRAPAPAGRAPAIFAGPSESSRESWRECAAPTLDRRTPSTTGGFAAAAASVRFGDLDARAAARAGAAEGVRTGAARAGRDELPATAKACAAPLPLDIATTTPATTALADVSMPATARKPMRRLRAVVLKGAPWRLGMAAKHKTLSATRPKDNYGPVNSARTSEPGSGGRRQSRHR